ncbi:MAG: hypothetical protein K8Q89_08380 [Nitrosarchaeum sp.]|nr:hypothetical protein [Nitrosarchaeum sp.]
MDIYAVIVDWFTTNLMGNDALSNWASLVTIMSLIIAPITYFVQRWHNDNSERKRTSKNLFVELNDALEGLDETKYSDLKKVTLGDGSEVYFMNRALNHDFYDSLTSSGKINFLKPELQQPLQDTFQRVKDHNFFIRKIREIEDTAKPDEDISSKTHRYYKILSECEITLLDEIPKMKEKLKKEFKIDGSISS